MQVLAEAPGPPHGIKSAQGPTGLEWGHLASSPESNGGWGTTGMMMKTCKANPSTASTVPAEAVDASVCSSTDKTRGFFFFLTECCQNPRATVPTWDALQEYAVGEGSSQPLSFSSAIRHGWSRGSFRWLLEGRTPLFPPKLSLVSGEQLGVTEDSQWGSEQHIPLTAPSSADGESIFVWREGLKILASCRVISKLECLIWCSYHLPGLPWWLSW